MRQMTASSSVVTAFKDYKKCFTTRLSHMKASLATMPIRQQQLLGNYREGLKSLASCAELNQVVLTEMVAEVAADDVSGHQSLMVNNFATGESTEVEAAIKLLVRDWSAEGADTRGSCLNSLLGELKRLYPEEAARAMVKVLVPGAGLGRLAVEVAALGFDCMANECSQFMLLAAQYIMKSPANSFRIYPWIHQLDNNLSIADATESVFCPDVDPRELLKGKKYERVSGDFLDSFSDPKYDSSMDCVVTCFFIDCAQNILDFIELIHRVLKPGGTWINFGPLAYCYKGETALKPSYEVLRGMIKDVGFTFAREETSVKAAYNQRASSMLQYHYQCVFFSCSK